jgi:curved DNA-binding protein CbpA
MASKFPDHYAVLHVPRTASQRQIFRAYRSLMRTHHPDLDNPAAAPAELQLIMQAFAVLRDPKRRQAYDRDAVREAKPAAPHTGRPARDLSRDKSQNEPQDIPVRLIRREDPPLRATPVRWESGPWAPIRINPEETEDDERLAPIRLPPDPGLS